MTKGKGKKSGREGRKKKHFSFQFLLLRVQAGPRLRTKEKSEKSDIVINREEKVVASSEFCAAYACTRDSRHREEGRRRHRYCVGRIISKVKNRSFFSLTYISPREKPSWLAVEGPCFSLEMKMKEIFFYFSFPQRLLSCHLWRQKEKECAAYVSPLWTFSSSPILLLSLV